MPARLLDESSASGYLRSRGVIGAEFAQVQALSGGVSNIVLAVDSAAARLVLKQSLERLRVRDVWLAPRARILGEAAALRLAAGLTPGFVPGVVDVDPERFTLTIERAPDDWVDWKTVLLAGKVDRCVGAQLGSVLARWHDATLGGSGLPDAMIADTDTFQQLRIGPYHETVAARHPELATAIMSVVDRMRATRVAMVHGDFSPKNVLVGSAAALWVIDFEVAHLGDPAFDLAFLLSHLVMKSVHLPEPAHLFDEVADSFVEAYSRTVPPLLAPEMGYLSAQLGCLLLARVDGKSPSGYLSSSSAETVWRIGTSLLTEPVDELSEIAERRELSIR